MALTVGIVGAVGSIGSSIMGGIAGGNAAKSAASAAAGQMEQARQFQEGVYNTAQTNLTPWISGGQEALGGVEQFLGLPNTGGAAGAAGGSGALASYNQFMKTPFYTFPQAQFTDNMNRAAAAKGLSLGSGQLMDLGKMGGNYAAGNFGNYMSALERLSGGGMTASTNLGQVGTSVGQEVGQSSAGIGNALAGGIMGQNLAQQNMFQGIGSALNQFAGGFMPGSAGPGGGTGSAYGSSQLGQWVGNQFGSGTNPAIGTTTYNVAGTTPGTPGSNYTVNYNG